MNIRRLAEADWEAYRAIRLEALQVAPEAFGSDFDDESKRPDEFWKARLTGGDDRFMLGAFAGQELVATAGFARETRRKTRHQGTIVGVYVAPAYRGRGIASAMMEAMLSEVRRLEDLEQVTLCVVTENVVARELYLRLGFRVFGTELRALKLGDRYLDEDHMVLFLGQ
jgi:ribosomal protein S18 acetylase RimI-like enzyme